MQGCGRLFCLASEMIAQSAKTGNDQEFSGAALQFGVFVIPTSGMGDKGGIESSLQSGVDLLLRTAADQPGVRFDHVMFIDEIPVHADGLIRHNLDGVKKSLQSRTFDFGSFFGRFAFGEENHPVAAGEIGKRFRHAVEYAWRSMLELGHHRSHFFEGASLGQSAGKFHVALLERPSEAAYAISMLLNIVPLGLIQDMPCVGAGVTEGLDQREKAFQGVLEKDVALPKSIVRIDEQS